MSRNDDIPSPGSKRQPRISSFFSQQLSPGRIRSRGKRAQSPIDLTSEPEEDSSTRPAKKLKTGVASSSANDKDEVPSQSSKGGPAEQWRFTPSAVTIQDSGRNGSNAESERLRKKAKKILSNDDVFSSQHQSAGSGEGVMAEHEDDSPEGASDPEADSHDEFDAILKTFASSKTAKGKGKGKRIAKPPPEIGPSGQAYTPLELQVRGTHTRC